ncbi:MAG: hypothetical protein QOE90_3309 [Thermoplasmata archaeon]|jgi:predicted DNA-binding protein|nr:hypothetical protein [Thermoplasmata archaeon]
MAERTIVRRVRLTREEDDRLARLAKRRGADVSTVIRDALDLAEREDQRRAAIDDMIRIAEAEQRKLKGRRPPKERWSLK